MVKVRLLFVTISLLYFHQKCSCGITIKNDSGITSLAEKFSDFVLYIGIKYFKPKYLISVLIPIERDNILLVIDQIVKRISPHWMVVTNDTYCCDSIGFWHFPDNKPVVIHYHPDIYIIPVYQRFEVQLTRMDKDDNFNPRAIFMLVLLTDNCGNLTDVHVGRIFNLMWRKNGFTVNEFLLSKCNHEFTIVTAKPFSPENFCRSVEKNGLRYIEPDRDEEKYNMNFIHYNPESFNGCNFVGGTKIYPPYVVGKFTGDDNFIRYEYSGGIGIELMRLLSKRLNFTLRFKSPISTGSAALYERLPNGTIIGFLRDVIEYRLDIVFGGLMPYFATYYHFQFSSSHTFNSLNWYVTDPSIVPQWTIIFIVFSIEIWVSIAFVFLSVCLLYWIMEHFNSIGTNHFFNIDFNETPFVNLFSVGLGLSSTLNPKRGYLRLLFVFWAVYCLHWNMAYTSVLFTLMTNPPLEKEVANIQDLYESGLKTSLDRIYLYFFDRFEIDKTTRAVLDKNFVCSSIHTCLEQLVVHRNFSVLEKNVVVESVLNVKRFKIHKLNKNMMSYCVSLFMSKGNPIGKGLNQLLLLTLQLGIMEKWESDVRWIDHKQDLENEEQKLALSIGVLQGAFAILFCGLVTAFLVFTGEIFMYVLTINRFEKSMTVK